MNLIFLTKGRYSMSDFTPSCLPYSDTTLQHFSAFFIAHQSPSVGLLQLAYDFFPPVLIPSHDPDSSSRYYTILTCHLCLLTCCFQLPLSFLFLSHSNHLLTPTTPPKPVFSGSPMIFLLLNLKIIGHISSYWTYQKHLT